MADIREWRRRALEAEAKLAEPTAKTHEVLCSAQAVQAFRAGIRKSVPILDFRKLRKGDAIRLCNGFTDGEAVSLRITHVSEQVFDGYRICDVEPI